VLVFDGQVIRTEKTMPIMKAGDHRFGRWLSATIGAGIFFIACRAPAQQAYERPAQQAGVPPASTPPESALPQSESIPSSSADLPSESQLPNETDQSPAPPTLPGEDKTPDDLAAVNDPEDRTSAALPGQIQPLLRLDFEGHTDTIRTLGLADGGRTLVSGGNDKDLHVWRRSDVSKNGWLHLRTVRWPITRGPRGRIYSASLNGDLAAFAGHSAFGGLGEIRVINAASGELAFEPLSGKHRQVIASLAWPPGDRSRLASADGFGQVVLWNEDDATGLWQGKTLVENDAVTLGEPTATALRPYRVFLPLTFLGQNHLIVPKYVRSTAETVLWHLAKVDVRDGSTIALEELDHIQHVIASCATPDGRYLASSDWAGSIAVWTFEGDSAPKAKVIRTTKPALAIDLDPSANRLLVGTGLVADGKGDPSSARLQLWDLQSDPPTLISEKTLLENVRAAKLDSEHNQAIITQGSRIEVHSFDQAGVFSDTPVASLTVPAAPVLKVAFSKRDDRYEVAFGNQIDDQGQPTLDGVFDFTASKLLGRGEIDPDEYLSPQRTSTRWKISDTFQTAAGFRSRLIESDQPRGVLPLQYEKHGYPTAICTLPAPSTGSEEAGEKPATGAVIVGTEGRNDIYVFAADDSDPPRLLRHFRGHSGAVAALTTSADGQYLVSGSEDMTMAVWNLQGLFEAGESTINLWGVDFEVDGDNLIAADVREDGPLYFRGVRSGDRLLSIRWVDDDEQTHSQSDAEAMFAQLLNVPFDQPVVFSFSRLGRPRPGLQSYPAWRPLATAFVDNTREWAFWTPAGYYDASFNGHQRFGWQINRGIDRTPDFFRAAQFRKALERPDIMKRLLRAGSLPAAMRAAPEGDDAIVNQYQNRPTIQLLEPEVGKLIEGDSLTVKATITVPLGATLIDPKAFVSGVPAVSRTLLATPETDENQFTYQWQFRLPSDPLLQLEVLASTEAEAVQRVVRNLDHSSSSRKTTPRLHLLAVGVGQYPDPQIPSLDFAAAAAADVASLFRTKASGLYRVTTDQLINQDATRSLWRIFAEQAAEELQTTVSPDDLVVMYLCGHGMRDRRTGQWYFVTADARYSDLMNDEYSHCIAFSDLAALSQLPCRKLAILDSCHSGAVQPVMQRDDLKSALRFLQDDLVLTVTASEGDEEAAEQRETRMGRFTAKLVEALGGAADQGGDQADQIVTLNEMIDYVTRAVAEESEQEGMPQHPTASPAYLLRTLSLPLAAVPSAE
jgi:WD40 repeat protein